MHIEIYQHPLLQIIYYKIRSLFTIHNIVRPILPRLKNTSYIRGFRIIVLVDLQKRTCSYIVRQSGDVHLEQNSLH